MTSERFFTAVWRINAIIFLLASTLACGVLIFVGWRIYMDTAGTRKVSNVVNVADEQLDATKAQLGTFENIAGSTVLRAPLRQVQEYGLSGSSEETASVQNYLFYDASDASAYWLVPGYKGLILDTRELPKRQYTDPEPPVVAFVYEMVDSDSDDDERLTRSDAKVIAVSNPSGSKFTRVLTGIEEVNGTGLTAQGRILVLYTAAATLKAAEIDVESHEVVRDSVLKVGVEK